MEQINNFLFDIDNSSIFKIFIEKNINIFEEYNNNLINYKKITNIDTNLKIYNITSDFMCLTIKCHYNIDNIDKQNYYTNNEIFNILESIPLIEYISFIPNIELTNKHILLLNNFLKFLNNCLNIDIEFLFDYEYDYQIANQSRLKIIHPSYNKNLKSINIKFTKGNFNIIKNFTKNLNNKLLYLQLPNIQYGGNEIKFLPSSLKYFLANYKSIKSIKNIKNIFNFNFPNSIVSISINILLRKPLKINIPFNTKYLYVTFFNKNLILNKKKNIEIFNFNDCYNNCSKFLSNNLNKTILIQKNIDHYIKINKYTKNVIFSLEPSDDNTINIIFPEYLNLLLIDLYAIHHDSFIAIKFPESINFLEFVGLKNYCNILKYMLLLNNVKFISLLSTNIDFSDNYNFLHKVNFNYLVDGVGNLYSKQHDNIHICKNNKYTNNKIKEIIKSLLN
jgi:hypothetical protein